MPLICVAARPAGRPPEEHDQQPQRRDGGKRAKPGMLLSGLRINQPEDINWMGMDSEREGEGGEGEGEGDEWGETREMAQIKWWWGGGGGVRKEVWKREGGKHKD